MIRKICVRAHDFGKNSIENIAEAISAKGFAATQLALKKALKNIEDIYDVLNPESAEHIKNALALRGIDISILGCYLNYGQQGKTSRQKNLEIFLKHLDLCEQFGARMVGTETGSLNDDYSAHRDNHGEEAYRIFLSSVEKMTEHAEETNSLVAIEAVQKHIINTAFRMKRIIDDIASENLVVIFDPVNLVTAENYMHQKRIIQEFFDLLGDRILAVHAKDFIVEKNEISVVPAGKGMLDYRLFLKLIAQSENEIDVSLENIKVQDMTDAKRFIEGILDG